VGSLTSGAMNLRKTGIARASLEGRRGALATGQIGSNTWLLG
jgi:hypothetical protein